MHVRLEDDLRVEVPELRPHHGHRVGSCPCAALVSSDRPAGSSTSFRREALQAVRVGLDELRLERFRFDQPPRRPAGAGRFLVVRERHLAVVGASGSLLSRRSWKIFSGLGFAEFGLQPGAGIRSWRLPAPPPLPKIEPMKANPAIACVEADVRAAAAVGVVGVDAFGPVFEVFDHRSPWGPFSRAIFSWFVDRILGLRRWA